MWNCWAYKMFENGRWMVFEQGMFNKITFNDLLWPKMVFWPEWSNKSKFLKESKIKKFFEKHKAEIFSHATPGHQLDMLSMRMEINIILLEDTTFWSKFLVKIFGQNFINVIELYPSSRAKCLPIVHYTEVNQKRKTSCFEAWKLQNNYIQVIYLSLM